MFVSRQRNRLVNTNYTGKKSQNRGVSEYGTGECERWRGWEADSNKKNVNSRFSLKELKEEADMLLLGQMERLTRPRPRLSKKAIARLPIVLAIAQRVITWNYA